MTLLVENQYIPPVIYYIILFKNKYIEIEQYEHWQKMSFRNRCEVATATGRLNLSVPAAGGRNVDGLTKEIKIDYTQPWQKQQWRTIISAYNHSPFFEYYRDELEVIFNRHYTFVWDRNLDLLIWSFEKLKWKIEIEFTSKFEKAGEVENKLDMRNQILPKTLTRFNSLCPHYTQVFEERNGFLPNLSIIDLLFCEGPGAQKILQKASELLPANL